MCSRVASADKHSLYRLSALPAIACPQFFFHSLDCILAREKFFSPTAFFLFAVHLRCQVCAVQSALSICTVHLHRPSGHSFLLQSSMPISCRSAAPVPVCPHCCPGQRSVAGQRAVHTIRGGSCAESQARKHTGKPAFLHGCLYSTLQRHTKSQSAADIFRKSKYPDYVFQHCVSYSTYSITTDLTKKGDFSFVTEIYRKIFVS